MTLTIEIEREEDGRRSARYEFAVRRAAYQRDGWKLLIYLDLFSAAAY